MTGAVGIRAKFIAPTYERLRREELKREEGGEGAEAAGGEAAGGEAAGGEAAEGSPSSASSGSGFWSAMSLAAFEDSYAHLFVRLVLSYGPAVSLDRAANENFQDVGEGFPAEVPAEEEVAKGGEKRKQRKGGGEEGGGKNGDGKNGDGKRRKGSVRGHDGNAESKKPESKKLGKFKCDRCSYKCSGSIDLKRHKSNTHDIDVSWIKCDRCEYKSKTTGHLKRHRASVHDGAT